MSALQAKDQSNRPRCEATHSPLPWKLDDSVHAGTRWIIADGLLCVRVLAGNFNSKDKPVLSDEERDANADYIVKACNQFPELLAAAKQAVAHIHLNAVTGFKGTDPWANTAAQICERLDSAIAKAESNG